MSNNPTRTITTREGERITGEATSHKPTGPIEEWRTNSRFTTTVVDGHGTEHKGTQDKDRIK